MGNWSGCQRRSETERIRWGGGDTVGEEGVDMWGYLVGGRGNKNRITDKNKEKEVEWDRGSGEQWLLPRHSVMNLWWNLGAKINILKDKNSEKKIQFRQVHICFSNCSMTYIYTYFTMSIQRASYPNQKIELHWSNVKAAYYVPYCVSCYVTIPSGCSYHHGSKRGSVENVPEESL